MPRTEIYTNLGYANSCFKDIFVADETHETPYDAFADWYLSIDSTLRLPRPLTFTLISYEYNECHVAFSDEGFKQHFFIDIYTFAKEFEETCDAIDALGALTADDIHLDTSMITNTAVVPEGKRSTSTEDVYYLSSQQKTLQAKGNLEITRELITTKRAYTVRTFLNRFKHLFLRVLEPAYQTVYCVPSEDDEN